MPESDHAPVIPAQLSYLAIYNPTLGPTDETLEDQIVFHTSRSDYLQRTEGLVNEEEGTNPPADGKNERLRQIGLAQGMVSFAGNFSDETLEYVETEKSRIVLLELEKDWWIVADIDFTRLPAEATQASSNDKTDAPKYHYSSREMGHPHLLIQQLRRAHSTFLLHHDYSLSDLYTRVGRSTFCLFMERFWEKFAWNWELLLSGNPIVEVYNGIKLAAGGELGIGVGEEEWGSGEREVLEDFVARTEGLQDLIVSRFGEPKSHDSESPPTDSQKEDAWLGSDIDPRPADGVVFSGVHNVSRRSVARISHWMEWIHRYGDATYGIARDPSSLRRRKPKRQRGKHLSRGTNDSAIKRTPAPEPDHLPGIPRPLITAVPQPPPEVPERSQTATPASSSQQSESSAFGTETFMKVLTLGYGSAWSLSNKNTPPPPSSGTGTPQQDSSSANVAQSGESHQEPKAKPTGRFILGARDDLETLDDFEDDGSVPDPGSNTKTRIVHRPLHLESRGETNRQKLHAVIYVHQPFMFTFLFDPETASLSSPSLYTSIHHQLGPLQKPLVSSTSATTATSRIETSGNNSDPTKRFASQNQQVYDLVYDPSNLTIRTSIPNIPSIGSITQALETSPPRTSSPSPNRPAYKWSRVESLAIHHHLLATHIDTRTRPRELERTCKTSRGWWVLWVRMPSTQNESTPRASSTASSSVALSTMAEDQQDLPETSSQVDNQPEPQEAFIIRKASDHASQGHARMSSGARFFRDLGGASTTAASRSENTPSKLVEGLGMDARRYVEGLLRLNR